MKKVLVSLLIVFAVAGAAVMVFVSNTKPAVPKIEERAIKETNTAERYTLDISYPEIMALGDEEARADANLKIKALIDAQIIDFKKQVVEIAEFVMPNDMSSGLWIDYSVALLSNDFISISFPISNYAVGAAHPNNYTAVFNYNAKEGRVIELGDLFLPGAPYLQVISDYAVADLMKQFGEDAVVLEDSIKSGAAPIALNYQNFVIKGETSELVMLFDPYQVASYAAGGREVVIPYDQIKDILVPGGPLTPSEPAAS
jgi:hypothetical protein